jgi:RNA polymerase II C-terminal domain phosphatase-like 3/4
LLLQGLRLGNDEIVRLRNTDMKNLLRHKKLYLILDLDHTLLNSTQLMHMTLDEEYLNGQTDSLQGFFCYLIIEFFPLVA